jgi:hypothetical protein
MSILFLLAAATTAAATPPAVNEPKKEKMICKAEKFVGSNRTRRICMTESQWRDGREGAKDTLNDIGRGGNYTQPQGPNN